MHHPDHFLSVSAVALSTFTLLCNRLHHQSPKRSHLYSWNSGPVNTHPPFLLSPSRWEASSYFLSLWIWLFWVLHRRKKKSRIIQYLSFRDWLTSLSNKVLTVHPCCSLHQHVLPFQDWIIYPCMYRPHFVYPSTCSMDTWSFPLFGHSE